MTDVEEAKCRIGDSSGSKEGIEVAPETNGMHDREEGEQDGGDQTGGSRECRVVETREDDELLTNEAEKETSQETEDTSSGSSTTIRYLVTPAEGPIADSSMEEREFRKVLEMEGKEGTGNKEVKSPSDLIAVKHDLQQMQGLSDSSIVYTVSSTVETYTDSVTYSKEDGFADFEENTSSSSSSKKAPYFKDNKIKDEGEVGPHAAFQPHMMQQQHIVHDFLPREMRTQQGEGSIKREEEQKGKEEDNNNMASSLNSVEGESEVQRVLRLQKSHDLLCPVCGSCITKRVILRKRKRTSPSVVAVEKWVLLSEEEIQRKDAAIVEEDTSTSPTTTLEEMPVVVPAAAVVHHDDGYEEEYEEDWGCLACFTLIFRRVWRRAEIPRSSASSSAAETQEPPSAEDYHRVLPQVEAETIGTVESVESVEVLPHAVEEDGSEHYSKNNCLPVFFPWRRQIVTTKLSRDPELLTPLLRDNEEEKMSLAEDNVVQMSTPTQSARELPIDTLNKQVTPELLIIPPDQPNVEQPQKITAASANAKENDINCLSIFLPPFPWGKTEQSSGQSNKPEVVATVAEQPALGSNKEVQAIESNSITIGSVNVPLSSSTVVTPTTLPGEISAAVEPVDVLPPPATTNADDEAGEQGRIIQESPRKASVNCLDLFLPAYPWEEGSEIKTTTTITADRRTSAIQEKEMNIQESKLASSTATIESEDLLDPNVVFPPMNSTSKEVILPVVVLTHPELPPKTAPENLVVSSSSSSTQGVAVDEVRGMDMDKNDPTKKVGVKLADIFHVPVYVKKTDEDDKITSVKVVDDQASKAGFNCLPLLLPPYPWEGATQKIPINQGRNFVLVLDLIQEKEVNVPVSTTSMRDEKALGAKLSQEEQLDSKCLPLKLPTLTWQRGGGGRGVRSGTVPSSSARKETQLESDVVDDQLVKKEQEEEVEVEVEEKPLVRKPPRIQQEKREVVGVMPKSVNEQEEKTEAIGVDETSPPSGGTLAAAAAAAASVGEGEQLGIKEENHDQDLLSVKTLKPVKEQEEKTEVIGVEEICDQDLLPNEEIEAPAAPATAAAAAVVEEISEDELPPPVLPVEKLESITAKKETMEAKESEGCSCGLLPSLLFPVYPWEPSSQILQTGQVPDEVIEAPGAAAPAVGAVLEEISEDEPPQHVLPVEKLKSITAKKETIEEKESEGCTCGLLPGLLFPAYPWEPSSQTETREEREFKWPAVADRGVETHDVVSRKTQIESRITTTTTTTTYKESADPTDEEHATVDAIKVDKSVSYMDTSIQHDDQPIQGTLVLDDSPTIIIEPKTLHHFPPISKFLDWDIPKKQHPSSATGSHAPRPALTYHLKDIEAQHTQEITEDGEAVVSEVSRVAAQTPQASSNATTEELNKSSFCECLPITPSYSIFFRTPTTRTEDDQLKEPLLSVEAKSDTDSHDSSVHVSLHQIHRHEELKLPISQMPDGRSVFTDDHEPASCNCLPPFLFSRRPIGGSLLSHKDDELQQPLLDKTKKVDAAIPESPTTTHSISSTSDVVSDETTALVIMTTDESVIEVYGRDVPSTLEAVATAAEDQGMMIMTSTVSKAQEYLKSVVYGGLDVSLISLGIVASAAGGDAKTRTVLAMGVANLTFGAIHFFNKVIDLHKESPMRFRETVGQSFFLNGFLAFLSFLVFGSLPTLMFGFSFRQSNNHDYKMLATVVVSVIAVVLLGCAKVFARVTTQSYFATLSSLIMTGVVAAVAGFYTGEYFSKLLAQFGFDI